MTDKLKGVMTYLRNRKAKLEKHRRPESEAPISNMRLQAKIEELNLLMDFFDDSEPQVFPEPRRRKK